MSRKTVDGSRKNSYLSRGSVGRKGMYEAPAITVLGTVEDLTHGQDTGSYLDQDFAAGTPFGDLTFSG